MLFPDFHSAQQFHHCYDVCPATALREKLANLKGAPAQNCNRLTDLSSRRAKRAGWPKGLKGCYIELATSYHQPHEYELVGR